MGERSCRNGVLQKWGVAEMGVAEMGDVWIQLPSIFIIPLSEKINFLIFL